VNEHEDETLVEDDVSVTSVEMSTQTDQIRIETSPPSGSQTWQSIILPFQSVYACTNNCRICFYRDAFSLIQGLSRQIQQLKISLDESRSKLSESNEQEFVLRSQVAKLTKETADLMEENAILKRKITSMDVKLLTTASPCLSVDKCTVDDDKTRFFTGLPSCSVFNAVFDFFFPFATKMRYWKGRNVEMNTNDSNPLTKRANATKIDLKNQFF